MTALCQEHKTINAQLLIWRLLLRRLGWGKENFQVILWVLTQSVNQYLLQKYLQVKKWVFSRCKMGVFTVVILKYLMLFSQKENKITL